MARTGRTRSTTVQSGPLRSQPELIVVATPQAGLRATVADFRTTAGADLRSLREVLRGQGYVPRPLLGRTEERTRAAAAPDAGADEPELSLFYRVEPAPSRRGEPSGPDERTLEDLAVMLRRERGLIDAAYVKPPARPAVLLPDATCQPAAGPETATTPDFTGQQGYLGPAPGGVDARHAWAVPGGTGAGVQIIDVEGAWQFSHEDLPLNQGGKVAGVELPDLYWRNHGTSVLGVLGGDRNGFGITGICPDAYLRTAAVFPGSAMAIVRAAEKLRAGDIILVELHRRGPLADPARTDDHGYIPIEFWEDDFQAIRHAVRRGVLVVAVAGNGEQDLDDPRYERRPPAFPTSWRNPFGRRNRDSGAILVGAGAPPLGGFGADRSRLGFSNWGSMVDAQGWGRQVTTTGGFADQPGDLQGGPNEEEWYTNSFAGTSSAGPIVVGALACLQGALRAQGRSPLTPAQAREELRATGSPQQDEQNRPASQRIGNRPDLRQLLGRTDRSRGWAGVQFTDVVPASRTLTWRTSRWPADWRVLWTMVPTTPDGDSPQVGWDIQVERAADGTLTYWISVTNLTRRQVAFEARYTVVG